MITRKDFITFIEEIYTSLPEYIFDKFPSYCVFRHAQGQKWFCLLMTIPKRKIYGESNEPIDVIDLKIDPIIGDIVRSSPNIYPAYHMNKKHWITIDLSQIDQFKQIADLIEDSYQLTAK